MKNKFFQFAILSVLVLSFTACKCDVEQVESDNTINIVSAEIPTTNAIGTLDENNNYIYNVGEFTDLILPNNDTLKVGISSTENKLASQLNSPDFKVSDDKTQGWVTLDRVYFETGKANITEASNTQIDHLIKILKAYPTANVKVGGYTDITGDSIVNQKVSTDRANTIAALFVSKGIAAPRIEAEGYGAKHFICEANDTEICLAQNRRVDIRVTKK